MDYPQVGVTVIIEEKGKVLLIQRRCAHGAGSWSTPGGHLEFGESPEHCAIRETLEEVGIEIGNVRFVAVTNDIFKDSGKHYISRGSQQNKRWPRLAGLIGNSCLPRYLFLLKI
jgi:8-oxo-dGTP diphosphatase